MGVAPFWSKQSRRLLKRAPPKGATLRTPSLRLNHLCCREIRAACFRGASDGANPDADCMGDNEHAEGNKKPYDTVRAAIWCKLAICVCLPPMKYY